MTTLGKLIDDFTHLMGKLSQGNLLFPRFENAIAIDNVPII